MTENKSTIYAIACGITTCLMYYSIGYLVYKFTSLEFIQSESCQHLMLLVFFITFVVSIKIVGIIERINEMTENISIMTKSQMINRIAELHEQLARKTQECEFNELKIVQLQEALRQYEVELDQLKAALKNDFISYSCNGCKPVFAYKGYQLDKLIEKYNQLKAKNEKLEKTIDDLLHKSEIQDKIFWKIDDKQMTVGLNLKINQLEQKLERIREICCGKSDKLYPLKEIIDIINEVE